MVKYYGAHYRDKTLLQVYCSSLLITGISNNIESTVGCFYSPKK